VELAFLLELKAIRNQRAHGGPVEVIRLYLILDWFDEELADLRTA
jgi:hypothetical protein